MTEPPVQVALIGFGQVGRRLARLFQAKRGQLAAVLGREWRLTALATARGGWVTWSDRLTITTHSGGPDRSAYDMLADLIAAPRHHPAGDARR